MAGAGAAAATVSIIQPQLVRGSSANSKVNLGLIGSGGRGTWIAGLFRDHGGYNVAAVADGHAATMAALSLMDHNAGGTTLGQRLATGGVGYSAAAENIAWNYPTGQAVSEGWMNSTTGHREAILGNYTHFGLAVRNDGGGPYWCCVFIR